MKLYRGLFRPALDLISGFDREREHHRAMTFLRMCGVSPVRQLLSGFTNIRNERKVFGVTFPNPVGAAAGFDKYGVALYGIEAFGFGFAEVGTVTSLPQPGNPPPRLFRLDEDKAVINRFGFNNDGAEMLARRLVGYRALRIPIGINIGKGKDTSIERAGEDYAACIHMLHPHADYFTINISSPNTKDLRRLHEAAYLGELLDTVRKTIQAGTPKPVLLKISPDLDTSLLDEVLETAESRVQGLVVCNTTTERPHHLHSKHKEESGGLSGMPLQARALKLVQTVHQALPHMPVIGVGGIFSPDDAKRMFDAGASLVQLYTGLVFEGPLLPYRINRALKEYTR